MSFQNLASMAWLLPTAGIIIALYLLRMRRKDLQVPATFLWPERTDEVRANSLFQRLRFSVLLLLQLLALTAVVIALARPQTKQKGLAGEVTVVVLDASASMGATDVAPGRFDAARREVEAMIGSASAGDRLALIEAGPTPRVVFPLGNDPILQRRAVQSLRRFDAESDVGEALRLAAALAGVVEGAKIVLLSDGVFSKVEDFSPGKAKVIFRPYGSQDANVAVQALGISEGSDGKLAYLGLRNHGSEETNASYTLTADGKTLDAATVRIEPGAVWGKTLPLPAGVQVVEARLDGKDLLRADDYGAALTDPKAALKVLLVGPGDFFLERALALDPRVTLDKAPQVPAGERSDAPGTSIYDIVVFAGSPEIPVKARGVLTLGSPGGPSPAVAQSSSNAWEFVSADDHPLLQGVDFGEVFIETGAVLQPKPNGRVIAEGKAGPLVVISEGRKRHVLVAFAPLQSDFPLSPGFPIFIANALDFLGGESAAAANVVRTGSPVTIPTDGSVKVTYPDGSTDQIDSRDGRVVLPGLTAVGRHSLEFPEGRRDLFASLRSDVESSIAPKQEIALGRGTVAAVREVERFADFWRPLLLLSLLVLAVEWWVYARRS